MSFSIFKNILDEAEERAKKAAEFIRGKATQASQELQQPFEEVKQTGQQVSDIGKSVFHKMINQKTAPYRATQQAIDDSINIGKTNINKGMQFLKNDVIEPITDAYESRNDSGMVFPVTNKEPLNALLTTEAPTTPAFGENTGFRQASKLLQPFAATNSLIGIGSGEAKTTQSAQQTGIKNLITGEDSSPELKEEIARGNNEVAMNVIDPSSGIKNIVTKKGKNIVSRLVSTTNKNGVVDIANQYGISLSDNAAEKIAKTTDVKVIENIINSTRKTAARVRSEGVKLKSNIRYDKLGIHSEEAKKEIDKLLDETNNFKEQRRGVRTWQETTDAAIQEVPKILKTLNKNGFKPGKAFNAEELEAIGTVAATFQTKIDDLSKKIASGMDDTATLLEFEKARAERYLSIAAVSGSSSEAGRALNILKKVKKALDPEAVRDERLIKEAFSRIGGRDNAELIARRLAEFGDDQVAKFDFVRKLDNRTKSEKFTDFINWHWYTSLLSGIKTQIRNTLGNGFHIGYNISTKPVAGLVDLGKTTAYKAVGKERERAVRALEVIPEVKGMISGVPEGFQKAWFMFKKGYSLDDVAESEFARPEMFNRILGGKLALPLNSVSRAMQATDNFFKSIVANSELHALAYLTAKNKKLKGKAYDTFINEFISDPPQWAVERMREAAEAATFQNKSKIAEGINNITGDIKYVSKKDQTKILTIPNPTKAVLPFVKTPINIIARNIDSTPLGFVTGTIEAVAKHDPRMSSIKLGRAIVGSTAIAAIYSMALQGNITGAGPKDKDAKDALMATGWRPNSVKIGDKYYNYQLFPFAAVLNVIGNLHDAQVYDGEEVNFGEVAWGMIDSITSYSFLEGTNDLLESISRHDVSYITKRIVGSAAVPFSAAMRTAAIAQDPNIRESDTYTDAIKSNLPKIPGLGDFNRQSLPIKKDILGNELQYEGGAVQRSLDPFNTSGQKYTEESEALKEALRLGVDIPRTEPKQKLTDPVSTESTQLEPDDRRKYQGELGDATKEVLLSTVQSDEYKNASDEDKKFMLQEKLSKTEEFIKGTYFLEGLSDEQKKEIQNVIVEYDLTVPSVSREIETFDAKTGNKTILGEKQRRKYYEEQWNLTYGAITRSMDNIEYDQLNEDEREELLSSQISEAKQYLKFGYSMLDAGQEEQFNNIFDVVMDVKRDNYIHNIRIDNAANNLYPLINELVVSGQMSWDDFKELPDVKDIFQSIQSEDDQSKLLKKLIDMKKGEGRNEFESFLAKTDTVTKSTYIFNEWLNAGSRDEGAQIMRDYLEKGIITQPVKDELLQRKIAYDKTQQREDTPNNFAKAMPVQGRITQDYDTHVDYIPGQSTHEAIDVVTDGYQPIKAIANGRIVKVNDSHSEGSMSGYGNEVTIEYENGVRDKFSHLQQGSMPKVGTKVSIGDVIGSTGRTGYRVPSTVYHTHWERYVNNTRVKFDPRTGLTGF